MLDPGPTFSRRPLFLTQAAHRGWALLGVKRGYVAVVYPGADGVDAAPLFQRAYPQCSMALIRARAFVVSRVLDFALSTAQNVVHALVPDQVSLCPIASVPAQTFPSVSGCTCAAAWAVGLMMLADHEVHCAGPTLLMLCRFDSHF